MKDKAEQDNGHPLGSWPRQVGSIPTSAMRNQVTTMQENEKTNKYFDHKKIPASYTKKKILFNMPYDLYLRLKRSMLYSENITDKLISIVSKHLDAEEKLHSSVHAEQAISEIEKELEKVQIMKRSKVEHHHHATIYSWLGCEDIAEKNCIYLGNDRCKICGYKISCARKKR